MRWMKDIFDKLKWERPAPTPEHEKQEAEKRLREQQDRLAALLAQAKGTRFNR